MGVILAHRLFRWTEYKSRRVARTLGGYTYALGCVIIVSIFCIMGVFASLLVVVSVNDSHSNIIVVEHVVPQLETFNYAGAYLAIRDTYAQPSRAHAMAMQEVDNVALVVFIGGCFFALVDLTRQISPLVPPMMKVAEKAALSGIAYMRQRRKFWKFLTREKIS